MVISSSATMDVRRKELFGRRREQRAAGDENLLALRMAGYIDWDTWCSEASPPIVGISMASNSGFRGSPLPSHRISAAHGLWYARPPVRLGWFDSDGMMQLLEHHHLRMSIQIWRCEKLNLSSINGIPGFNVFMRGRRTRPR